MTCEQELKEFAEICDMLGLSESYRIAGAVDILNKHGKQSTGLQGSLNKAIKREDEVKAIQEAMKYIQENEPLMQNCARYYANYVLYCTQNQVMLLKKSQLIELINKMGYVNKPTYISLSKAVDRVWIKKK